uniref:Uncharacterized protein n=1 Tax=Sus scrofa TaxID=9823 RepID=A0A8D1YKP3_PIG
QGWFIYINISAFICPLSFSGVFLQGVVTEINLNWQFLPFSSYFTLFYFILFGLFSLEAEDAQLHSLRKNRTQEIQPVIQDKRLDVSLSSAIFTYFTYQCYSCSLKLHLRR